MKKHLTFNPKLTFIVIPVLSLLSTGCLQSASDEADPDEDGQSAFIASEIDQLGQALESLPGNALTKTSASDADTLTGERVVERFAYQQECECFVRIAEYSDSRGYERTRLDSVTLLDSDGVALDHWDRGLIAKIVHNRHVTRHRGSHDMDVVFNTVAEFKTDNGTVVGVWNGTMNGFYEGEEFKSAAIEKVTREFAHGKFAFPVSGTVTVTRPLRIYAVEFLGDGKAVATITNRRTGRATLITIDRDYQEKAANI